MGYGEPATYYFPPETPKARKEHQCNGCYTPIAVGEVHQKFSGVWEGTICTCRMHTDCWTEYLRLIENEGECIEYEGSTKHLVHPTHGEE